MMLEEHSRYTSADGQPVTLSQNHCAHIESAHPGVVPLLAQATSRLSLAHFPANTIIACIDFGRPIGTTQLVALGSEDRVWYAIRDGRAFPSRVVRKSPSPTTFLSLLLQRHRRGPGAYIKTACFGNGLDHKELVDPYMKPEEREAAERFWLGDGKTDFGHALCYDPSFMGPLLPLQPAEALLLAQAAHAPLLEARTQRNALRQRTRTLEKQLHAAESMIRRLSTA